MCQHLIRVYIITITIIVYYAKSSKEHYKTTQNAITDFLTINLSIINE